MGRNTPQPRESPIEEAVVTGECTIEGLKAILAVMSFDFMGGSMGALLVR